MTASSIQARLKALSDPAYGDFHSGLIPGLDREKILGVRMPALRRLERELRGTQAAVDFMSTLPHEFYDEYCLHGLLINSIKAYPDALLELERFLPYVDNWAVCDLLSPAAFKARPNGLMDEIKLWISSGAAYTVRFGLGVLMGFYLDEGFAPEQLELAASCCCEEYYVNMMVAWYFATALCKQERAALPYIEGRRLSRWVHNRSIQKAIESRRIPPELKDYLRTLRWK